MDIKVLEIIYEVMFFIPCSGTSVIDDAGLLITNCSVAML